MSATANDIDSAGLRLSQIAAALGGTRGQEVAEVRDVLREHRCVPATVGPCQQCGYRGEIVTCPDETGPICARCSDEAAPQASEAASGDDHRAVLEWSSAELLEKFRRDLAEGLNADASTGFPDLLNLVHLAVKRAEEAWARGHRDGSSERVAALRDATPTSKETNDLLDDAWSLLCEPNSRLGSVEWRQSVDAWGKRYAGDEAPEATS